jgi:hypothetical protein
MRSLLLALLVVGPIALPATAHADAIMPFDGACPPGLERAIRNHAEVCSPAACRTGRDCPEGSSCETLFECWAERTVSGGRRADEEAHVAEIPIGPCAEGRHCGEGVCRERRQCEPTEATPAWNRSERRWTREAYVASSGCSAGAARGGSSAPMLMLLALGLVLRKSR